MAEGFRRWLEDRMEAAGIPSRAELARRDGMPAASIRSSRIRTIGGRKEAARWLPTRTARIAILLCGTEYGDTLALFPPYSRLIPSRPPPSPA